jgi:hypothetical protein
LSSDFGLRTLDFGPLRFEHSRCSLLCFLLCVHGANFKSNVKGDGQECPPHIFWIASLQFGVAEAEGVGNY